MHWQRTERAVTSWRNTSATSSGGGWRERSGTSGVKPRVRTIPVVAAGDRVLHATFGMGKVLSTSGSGDDVKADVDFGSSGIKRLALKYAPLEKL